MCSLLSVRSPLNRPGQYQTSPRNRLSGVWYCLEKSGTGRMAAAGGSQGPHTARAPSLFSGRPEPIPMNIFLLGKLRRECTQIYKTVRAEVLNRPGQYQTSPQYQISRVWYALEKSGTDRVTAFRGSQKQSVKFRHKPSKVA